MAIRSDGVSASNRQANPSAVLSQRWPPTTRNRSHRGTRLIYSWSRWFPDLDLTGIHTACHLCCAATIFG